MNRSPNLNVAVVLRHPKRLAAGLAGVALLLLGGVHLAQRLIAHLALWSLAVPVPGLFHLTLFAAGIAAVVLVLRRGHGNR